MDVDLMGAGGGGNGQVGQFPLEQWFYEMPVCTRWWTAAMVVISFLLQCDVITPYQLFYSYRAVFIKNQFWRLITTFLYFGPLSLDLLFHVFFHQRYSRLLEESSGRSAANFSWLLLYATGVLLLMSPILNMPFLGQSLSSTMVYIWSRRNPETRLSFLGVMNFTAPYLPWVLMAFSLLLHGRVPKDEICGVIVGHVWYYFNDVYPPLHHGHRPFDPPAWWFRIIDGRWPTQHDEIPVPDDADENRREAAATPDFDNDNEHDSNHNQQQQAARDNDSAEVADPGPARRPPVEN